MVMHLSQALAHLRCPLRCGFSCTEQSSFGTTEATVVEQVTPLTLHNLGSLVDPSNCTTKKRAKNPAKSDISDSTSTAQELHAKGSVNI